MNSNPLPALAAALAALVTLPFSVPAAGTLLFVAGLGAVIHADYVARCQRVRLPRLTARPAPVTTLPLCCEPHQLAA